MSVHQPTTDDAERSSTTRASTLSITKDDAFHILQNPRRRAVLRYLRQEGDDEFQMREVAEAVAAWEHETTVVQLSSGERQRVYIALYQSHLPKLADRGVIEYNQPRGIVKPTPLLTVFAPFLADRLDCESDALTAGIGAGKTDRAAAARFTATIASFLDR